MTWPGIRWSTISTCFSVAMWLYVVLAKLTPARIASSITRGKRSALGLFGSGAETRSYEAIEFGSTSKGGIRLGTIPVV